MSQKKTHRVFVAGHKGMVGNSLCKRLAENGDIDIVVKNRVELDLLNSHDVLNFFATEFIDEVYLAAAKVGGIHANNTYPADFIQQNLAIQLNVISASHESGVEKLLFLGSSCIYPRQAQQPITEEQLLTGELEPTNAHYAIAKIAGIKLCESYRRQYGSDFRSIMPTNLYGPGDNYHLENSHVVPALIRRFHEAVEQGSREIVIWGSGKPMREFLHVDDLAAACVHVMNISRENYDAYTSEHCSHINVGTGEDCTIRELAETLAEVTGFKGQLVFDTTKPDGTPRKLLDTTRIRQSGWMHSIGLQEGLEQTCRWYRENLAERRLQ